MKVLSILLILSASCGKTGSKTETTKQPKNSDDGTASTATPLVWKEGPEFPESLKLPLKSASLTGELRYVLKDSADQFFMFRSDSVLLTPLNIPQDALNLLGSRNFEQASETSAWSMSETDLTWVRWGISKKDLAISKVPLSGFFSAEEMKSVKLKGVQENSVLLTGSSKSVHIRFDGSERQTREFEGVVTSFVQASDSGHIFTVDTANNSLMRLLELDTPRWHRHNFVSNNFPEKVSFVRYDISGRPDALYVSGIAAVGKNLWFSQPAALGSSTQPVANNGTTVPLDKQKLTKETEALFIQYCAGCHEGRSPAFVKTTESGKDIISGILLNEKEKIIRLMNLPPDDPKVMPPYGRPRPNAAELKVMSELE